MNIFFPLGKKTIFGHSFSFGHDYFFLFDSINSIYLENFWITKSLIPSIDPIIRIELLVHAHTHNGTWNGNE